MKKNKDNLNIKKKVLELNNEQPWNHNIVLPNNIETRPGNQISHGKNLVKWKRIEPIKKQNLFNLFSGLKIQFLRLQIFIQPSSKI